MKRKIVFCTLALTTLLLVGCGQGSMDNGNIGTPSSTAEISQTDNGAQTDPQTQADNQQQAGSQTQTENQQQTGTQAQTDIQQQNGAQNQTGIQQQTGTQLQTNNQQQAGTQAHPAAGQDGSVEADMISEEEAKQIALSHAGLTSDQATFIKSGIDRDNGRKNYDVEFYTQDNKEYDYEIDPYTGQVLDYDYDAEYYMSSSNTATGETITTDAAKEIALGKVSGATANDIREFETGYDNGRMQYEGKILFDRKEYEFEIDAYSGDILEWDVENIYGDIF